MKGIASELRPVVCYRILSGAGLMFAEASGLTKSEYGIAHLRVHRQWNADGIVNGDQLRRRCIA